MAGPCTLAKNSDLIYGQILKNKLDLVSLRAILIIYEQSLYLFWNFKPTICIDPSERQSQRQTGKSFVYNISFQGHPHFDEN